MSLVLDHVSVQTPTVDAMAEMLRERLGLITTRTPGAPERHGRVYLDRRYLEVASGAKAVLAHFFLRYDHLDDTVEALSRHRLRTRVGTYEGHDGIWQEIEMDASTTAPLPFLIRRMTPPEVAADWPPPLAASHPCGAEALAAVHLCVPRLEPALEIYERILDSSVLEFKAGRAAFQVTSGRIVLREVAECAPSIVGLELRVASLEHTQWYLSRLKTKTRRAEGVLWAEVSMNWQLGFCETARGDLPRGASPLL